VIPKTIFEVSERQINLFKYVSCISALFFLYYALMKLKDQKLFLNAEMFSLLYYLHTWVMSNPTLVSIICYLSLLISLFALRICHPC
jgi:hypothetical protein